MKKIILFGLCFLSAGLFAQSTFRTGIRVADSFLPTTNGGVAIGSVTRQFSGEFLFTGGAINWDNGDITITHSANTITLAGGDLALGGNNLTMTGSLAATANRVLKGWFTNLEITNLPTVTTSTPSIIYTRLARGGGTVTDDGGGTVSDRGICWSTSANPSVSDSKTSNGTGTGAFTDYIPNLTAGTVYHIRGYAINETGTSYGSDLTVTTPIHSVTKTGGKILKTGGKTVIIH